MRSKGTMASALAVVMLSVMTMAAPSLAAPIPCTGPLGAVEINGDISAGAGCDLSGATVRGNVTVSPGGSLSTIAGSTTVIAGNVESTRATQITLEGATSVRGELQLTGTTESIDLNSGTVKGNVEIEDGIANVTVGDGETVDGNVQIQSTSGAASGEGGVVVITGSTVGGNVEVADNSLTGSLLNLLAVVESSVAGNLELSNNSATGGSISFLNAVLVASNFVGGNAELVSNTSGSILVSKNEVTNNLECEANKPPPEGSSNAANEKQGQCEQL